MKYKYKYGHQHINNKLSKIEQKRMIKNGCFIKDYKTIAEGHTHIGNQKPKGVIGNKRFIDSYIESQKKEKNIIIVDDLDNPKNDKNAVNAVKRFIKWLKPDKIINIKK